MATIDERVVAMSFENSRFETNVSTTLKTLSKLDSSIANVGKVNGLTTLESSAQKVTLSAPMSALDKLKRKLGFTNAGTTFTDMEKASDKVTLQSPMSALDKLKSRLGSTNAGTTFTDIENAADRTSFSSFTNAVDGIAGHFTTLRTAAGVALGGIVLQATQKGAAIAKSLSLDPVVGGFQEYQTNLKSIQTILSNTRTSGGNLKTVNSALQELNRYSDQTIYNFGEMAKNIGTFTAAGVQLKPAVASIKGIANLAALSGSSSEQASTAMYQLSQAIASGKVGLQDWNSVVNAGMGGAVFQKALIRTGQSMGEISKGAVEIDKKTGQATINGESFRESIMSKPGEKSWLTSKVLTNTLQQFTGDLSDAELKAQGFTDAQIEAIQSQARAAKAAATQVKSLPQVFDVAKETIGSGWAKTFQTIFGDFGEAKSTFTDLSNTINGFINTNADARNKVLTDWKKLGGRTVLIDGIKNAFTALKNVVKPIHDAFREIFPAKTGQDLFNLTTGFRDLMKRLQLTPETMDKVKRVFAGLFAVLHIGWTVVKTVVGIFGKLLGASKGAAGGFLGIAANLGDFLKKLDDAVKKKGLLEGLFGGLSKIITDPLKLIKQLGRAIKNLFTGGDASGAAKGVSGPVNDLKEALAPLRGVFNGVKKAWGGFVGVLDKLKTAAAPLLENISEVFKNFGDTLADGIQNTDYSKVFTAVQTVLIGGIFVAIKKALGGGINVDFGGGMLKSISGTFKALTTNLQVMQKNIQAHTLLTIAFAIGILAAAVAVLSLIDPKKLSTALTAVAIGMGELVGVVYALNKAMAGGGTAAFLKMPVVAASLILLSTALVVLGAAMKIFATMSWEELAKGLVGVGGGLVAVSLGVKLMEGPKILVTAAALLPLAIALNILAIAMKIFATMSWEEIAKGVVSIVGALTAIGLAVQLMPPTLPLIGAGLILVSAGLVVLAGAILAFGSMDMATLAKGIGAMAVALVLIGLAISTFPPTMALQALGLLLVAGAMTVLAGAIGLLGQMQISTLVKGIAAMGVALLVLSVGLGAMSGTLAGSAALMLAAAALAVLVPTLGLLGAMPFGVILKGIGGMVLAIGALAVVGLVASGPLTLLGIAIGVLGLGLLAVGAAIYLAAKGLSLLSDTGTKAVAVLIGAITAFIVAIPSMAINFVKGLVEILSAVAALAPKIVTALVSILGTLLNGIVKLAPKIAETVGVLITSLLRVLVENAPKLINAGAKLLLSLLSGISRNIWRITSKAVTIVLKFLGALTSKMPRLITAGAKFIVSVLDGIANNIGRLVRAGANVIVKFLNGIANNVWRIIAAGGRILTHIITGIGNVAWRMVKAGANAIIKFVHGVGSKGKDIIEAGLKAAKRLLNAIADGIVRFVDIAYRAMIRLLNGLARTIRKNNKPLTEAGWNLAKAIIDSMVSSFKFFAHKVYDKIKSIGKHAVHLATHPWQIGSPSKVMIRLGKNIMLGMAKGLEDNSSRVNTTLEKSGKSSVRTVQRAFDKIPDVMNDMVDFEPTITPVLDISKVQKDAAILGSLMPSPVLTPTTSTDQAAVISDQQRTATETAPVAQGTTTINYHQNNYSPDPLPSGEIYRQTQNQLARAKQLVGA